VTRRTRIRFHEPPDLADAAGIGAPRVPSGLEVVPSLQPRDEAIFLLHTAAEIEHALMVQYLYAAWSLPADATGTVGRWRRAVLQIAREEMAHLATVQNLLRFVGGPLNLDREDFPYRSELYPFPFRLEPLGRASLARFVTAEMPVEPNADEVLVAQAVALATDGGAHPVNRVGALYGRLVDLFAEGGPLLDSELRPQTAGTIQARPEHFRADVGDGPYFLRTVGSRAQALALVDDVADQGEGDRDTPYSHFSMFLEMFDGWPVDTTLALDVPVDPSIHPRGDGNDPGLITNERAVAWATIFNQHYRLLLGWLQHALLTPRDSAASSGLCLRVFGEMLALAEVGQFLVTLPRAAEGAPRAGAPFELPYTLAFPDLPGDRWDHHRDLLVQARASLSSLPRSPDDDSVRARLAATISAAQNFVDVHATGSPM